MEKTARRKKNIHRKVLIVDDEFINRQLLGAIVEREYEVLFAENGLRAMEKINDDPGRISLILLDLLMPEVNGYELLEFLKADEELRRIPVIVLTSDKSAEVRSLNMGAADFIPKTYDAPEVIMARVGRSIELAEDNVMIQEAENDELTGLYTKEFFFQYSKQRDRYLKDVDMDALVLNINRFHLVNELYGRDYGARVLQITADCIRDYLDRYDGLGARCGADDFYIYVPHREDHGELLELCTQKLSSELDNSSVSYRLGVYARADMQADIEQRFDRANLACSKKLSPYLNTVSVYDEKLHETELFNEKLMNDMDKALREKQFVVYYQPKYDIRGDRPVLTSAEALIRWVHPELGMVSPGAFIPLFEENGLIQKLDRYVWREAAAQTALWKKTYGITVPVSVNVSRIDIYDPELENELLHIVSSEGLSPREYLLEITESAYTDNSTQITETVSRLRADGFRVEMDDFGSGYSSLNMLTALPIDALKLDMKFIKNICTSSKDLRMVELMMEIAAFLAVPVIAEGVETREQYELLKKTGCDIIQGYYFSRPVPPADFDKLIEKEKNDSKEESRC
ncbi:MAG: EAL domain-containing protein [Ruminococcus sp.]|nr:EAL domain-containing protein [Ruminococcus sp.]